MRSSHAKGLDIKLIFHPIFVSLILLAPRDLQLGFPLLPLCHECAAAILSYEIVLAHLLWMALKLIICAESIQIRHNAIRFAGLAEFTQSEKAIGGQVVNLKIKLPKLLAKELDGRQAKAA